MECRDVRLLADSFLTEQLLVETTHELVRHLETCPDCRADIASRRAMRARLRGAIERAGSLTPREAFAAELSAKLRPQAPPLSRRTLLRSGWALAAGLVLAAGGLFVRESRSRSRLVALARLAAGDHRNCAVEFHLEERPIPMAEAGRRYGAPYAGLAAFELPTTAGRLDIVDRHACVYQGRRFGHLVVRYQGALTSVLVTEGVAPASAQLEPRDGNLAVASLPAGRFVGFVVADLDATHVLTLARALEEPLSQHLS